MQFYNEVHAGYFVVSSADDVACHSIDDMIVLKAPKAVSLNRINKFAYTYPDNIIEIIKSYLQTSTKRVRTKYLVLE